MYNMYKKITSTQLKQETRKVLKQLDNEPEERVLVYNYNEPIAWLIKYDPNEPLSKKPKDNKELLEEISKYFVSSETIIDSAKEIRSMRDEE